MIAKKVQYLLGYFLTIATNGEEYLGIVMMLINERAGKYDIRKCKNCAGMGRGAK